MYYIGFLTSIRIFAYIALSLCVRLVLILWFSIIKYFKYSTVKIKGKKEIRGIVNNYLFTNRIILFDQSYMIRRNKLSVLHLIYIFNRNVNVIKKSSPNWSLVLEDFDIFESWIEKASILKCITSKCFEQR